MSMSASQFSNPSKLRCVTNQSKFGCVIMSKPFSIVAQSCFKRSHESAFFLCSDNNALWLSALNSAWAVCQGQNRKHCKQALKRHRMTQRQGTCTGCTRCAQGGGDAAALSPNLTYVSNLESMTCNVLRNISTHIASSTASSRKRFT